MRVLVIGGGGREQAIAWACRHHGHDVRLAPDLGDASPDDTDLVFPGPEAALVAGVADECARRGIPCFGPTAELARLEASKTYARELATSLGIPGPRFAAFDDHDAAIAWWRELDRPVVVKLDGLAAGKGVTVPDGEAATIEAIRSASGPFLLEERLTGPECSLLALCDGVRAVALPLAQDHKRLGEGDTGPNTGGMGAYAPAPVPYGADDLVAEFVQPVLDHFASAGTPYVGVIFAGLMLTADGPRLIEYNVRLGDPEAQTVLPLVETDIAELALLATQGELDQLPVIVRSQAAVTVVAAAAGYPGAPIAGAAITDEMTSGAIGPDGTTTLRFDAGVDADGCVAGGRVLAVTGIGFDLAEARAAAYDHMGRLHFDGMQFRRDIGWRALGAELTSYAAAGVDIDEGTRAVSEMKAAVEATHDNGVLKGVGSFGGVFSAKAILELDDPVLVASTDGVGTKVELAARLGMVRGVGMDIVNHCIDDVLVQSARPLFFLDYIAASVLDADMVAEVVRGMADACKAAGCALLGGETAEMPGVYQPGAFDIAGTLVGVAERSELLPRPDVARRRRARRRGVEWAAHQRLLAPAQDLRLDPDGRRARRVRPSARRDPARTAPLLPRRAAPGARLRHGEGARTHHRRWPAREPAAGAARRGRCRRPPRLLARVAAVPARPRAHAPDVDRRAVPHPQHGHRHGRDLRSGRPRHAPGRHRRTDLGHR